MQRCRACRGWQWGPEWICHRCHSFDSSWAQVEAARPHLQLGARLASGAPGAARTPAPTSSVLVELPDAGGVRMVGNLLGDPLQAVEIGAPVEAVFEPHDDATPPFTLVQWRRTA